MQALNSTAPFASRTRGTLARRMAGVLLGLTLALTGAGASATPPPAGTSIGNQATATYTDSSGISRTVTSNTTQTVVQQVAALTMTPVTSAKTATPGGTVYYPGVLTNTGNGTDSFNLTATQPGTPPSNAFSMTGIAIYADNGSGAPTGSPITAAVSLASNASFKFVVVGTLPTSATVNYTNAITVTGASVLTSSVTASDTDTTTVSTNAVITLNKSVNAASGAAGAATQYTYTIAYTNTGNNTAPTVKITDAVPAGMSFVANSGLWSASATHLNNNNGSATPGPVTVTVGSTTLTYDYGVTTPGTMTASFTNIAPGQSGTISFQVTVNAGTPAGTLNNTALLSYTDGGGNTVPGASNTVPFTVTRSAAVAISSSTVASAALGTSFTFSNTVTNNGNATDTFNITYAAGATAFPAGTTFQLLKADGVTPLIDTNGDGIPDTGPVAAGGTYVVTVKVTLPATSSATAPFLESITATSTNTGTVSATGTDTLSATSGGAAVDVTASTPYNASALGYGPGSGTSPVLTNTVNPGATTTLPLYVNNTGTIADTYNLSIISPTTLPTGWTVTFYADGGAGNCSTLGAAITATPTINAGGNSAACAVVSVPAGYAPGLNVFKFGVQSPVSGAQDTINEGVTVNTVRSLTFTTNNSGQASIGGVVYYTHVIKNTGNVTEGGTASSIALGTSNNQASWTSVLYFDAAGTGTYAATDPIISVISSSAGTGLPTSLAPGASITIFDKVTVPASSADGVVNVTTLTVTTTNGTYTTTVPSALSNTDTTTVVAGNVTLVKTQVLDATCAGTATGFGTAQISALPGGCVIYQITVQNIGSTNATNVSVSDATPAYTTLAAKPTPALAPTITGVSVTAPAAGAAGTVGVVIPTLTPGQSEVLTFGVQIQQ
jgi:uncharacterized repeat protein (TIGR01451 family)